IDSVPQGAGPVGAGTDVVALDADVARFDAKEQDAVGAVAADDVSRARGGGADHVVRVILDLDAPPGVGHRGASARAGADVVGLNGVPCRVGGAGIFVDLD